MKYFIFDLRCYYGEGRVRHLAEGSLDIVDKPMNKHTFLHL